jgi:hypothetical protein
MASSIEAIMAEAMDSSNIYHPNKVIRMVLQVPRQTCSKATQWNPIQKENDVSTITISALFSSQYRFNHHS